MLRLVHDVLDKQVLDAAGAPMGCVDGIGLELRPGEPPRVAFVEIGAVALARRVGRRLARWIAGLERRLGVSAGRPLRIPWPRVRDIGIDVEVDVSFRHSRASAWERWIERVIVSRIPGA